MNIDSLVEKLNVLNTNYMWIIDEGEKILKDVDKAMVKDDYAKVEELRNKFIELENRHTIDKKAYNKIIKESRAYFKTKYNLDLFDYFELEDI